MKYSVICNKIDDCTLEFIRDGNTVIVARQSCYIYVINPNINIDDCPLINYVGVGQEGLFFRVITDICFNSLCDSYFGDDVKRHVNNGYPVRNNQEEFDKLLKLAKETLETYNEVKAKWAKPENTIQSVKDSCKFDF